jgi:hypothetical protein
MEDLSVLLKVMSTKSLLGLFVMAAEKQEFRYALMALFFSFQAVCKEDQLRLSEVFLEGVDSEYYQVTMWQDRVMASAAGGAETGEDSVVELAHGAAAHSPAGTAKPAQAVMWHQLGRG